MAKKSKKKKKENHIKKIGTYLSITAFILLIGGLFVVFGPRGGGHNIAIEITPQETVSKGVPLELEIDITNNMNEPLREVELSVNLSDNLVNLDFESDQSVYRTQLNNLGEGTLTKETLRVLPTGDVGSEEEVTAQLSYVIGSASFEKEVTKTIPIEKQPIEIAIEKPEQILGGSSFETVVTYKNTSDFDFPELRLQAQYPESFTFISANLTPTALNNSWDLGALKSGSEGEIRIQGTVQNGGQETSNISAAISAAFLNTTYEIARAETSIQPSQSPLSLDISLSGAPRLNSSLTYRLQYENKSGVALRDATISSELAGEMFDLDSIETNGNVNTLQNQILWNEDVHQNLEVLEPGESGSVTFSINLQKQYPIRRLSDKNFEVVVRGLIESPTVPYYVQAQKTSASSELKTKIEGKTEIDAQAYYRDAQSGILNEGTFPPRVGESTQFTVHWAIKNYSTDIENVVVSAPLPENVEWSGQVQSNIDSVPIYNSEENTVSWEIDRVSATRGLISLPIEGIFQVEITPTTEYRNSYHPIIGKTTLEARDTWTNKTISISDIRQDTSLPDDSTVNDSDGLVQ